MIYGKVQGKCLWYVTRRRQQKWVGEISTVHFCWRHDVWTQHQYTYTSLCQKLYPEKHYDQTLLVATICKTGNKTWTHKCLFDGPFRCHGPQKHLLFMYTSALRCFVHNLICFTLYIFLYIYVTVSRFYSHDLWNCYSSSIIWQVVIVRFLQYSFIVTKRFSIVIQIRQTFHYALIPIMIAVISYTTGQLCCRCMCKIWSNMTPWKGITSKRIVHLNWSDGKIRWWNESRIP